MVMNILPQALAAAALLSFAPARAANALEPEQAAEMLAAHNQWRREVGSPPVKWSANLAASARAWADRLQQAQCALAHSATRDTGENLYFASPLRYSNGETRLQSITPTRVAGSWASEKPHYDGAAHRCAPGKVCGHYTQMVWRTTTEIGCARAVCADLSQVWVCHYAPAGNWRGQRPF